MNTPLVIGFAGPKGCGKTFNAMRVCHEVDKLRMSFSMEAFATPLKCMLSAIGVPHEHLHDPSLKETPLSYPFEGLTARRLMQTLGTEWGRDMASKSLWVDLMDNTIAYLAIGGTNVVIIDDVRFADEAQYVTSQGVLVYLNGSEYAKDHQSEMPLDVSGLPNVFFSENVEQTLAHLKPLLERLKNG